MCLAAFALKADERFPLVIAANRDEFYARPAAPMDWWADAPDILAGRDLQAGGTWFGLSRSGRIALLTNVREPSRHQATAPSRGALVTNWLNSDADAVSFAAAMAEGYNGFNLVTGDLHSGAWHCISNRAQFPLSLPSGFHALSNAAMNTPWPKTTGLQADVVAALRAASDAPDLVARLMQALADATPAPDSDLPETGVGLERERALSARCVRMPAPPDAAVYGTRCSTVLVLDTAGGLQVHERSLTPTGVWQAVRSYRVPCWPTGSALLRS